jgi:hypothetical protein
VTQRSVSPLGRIWYAVTALAVLAGVVIETVLVAGDPPTGSPLAGVANLFTFFTIQSNLLVGIAATLMASGRARDATWFRALVIAALLAISITALVWHGVLAGPPGALSGSAAIGDVLVHTISPALFVVGWLVFGPRVFSMRAVLLSLLYPLAWLAFTLIRGAVADYYPYPFMDVSAIGYARTSVNLSIIVGLALVLVLAFTAIERTLGRLTHQSS